MNQIFRIAFLSMITLSSTLRAGQISYIPVVTTQPSEAVRVMPIPDELRRDYEIDPFYKKCAIINGVPIIGAEEVSTYAFLECAYTLDHCFGGQKKTLDAMVHSKVRVGIIGVNQYTMDIPENQTPDMIAKGAFHDRRSRGLGGLPLATCAEENLLNLRGDPYTAENITIHEVAHTIASAIREVDRDWYRRLRTAYKDAKTKGIYGDSYAGTNEQEYWAEGAQCWFDCANPRNAGGASNRKELKEKDPALAILLTEVYGDNEWRCLKTSDPKRPEDEKKHLIGFDREKMPKFSFDNSPRIKAAAATQAAATQPTTRP